MTRPLIRDVASQSNPDPTAATLGTAEPEPFAATAPGASAPEPIPTPAILGPLSQEGTNLVLRWSYPRTTEATPTRFILSYTGENFYSLVLYAVPLHEVTACQQVMGVGPDTWCARLACPGAGTWHFTIQADYGTSLAPASNTVDCLIPETSASCACM